jgi:hypothetical protein
MTKYGCCPKFCILEKTKQIKFPSYNNKIIQAANNSNINSIVKSDLLKSTDDANNNEVITLLYCMQVKVNKQIINVPSVSNISNEEIEDIKRAIDKINNSLLALI